MAGLRPDVLQRDALQRRQRGGSEDDVLLTLPIRAALEISDQTRETGEGRPDNGSKSNSTGDPGE